jgi:protein-disulfide isomerase
MHKKETLPIIPPRDMVIGAPGATIRMSIFGDYESVPTRELHEIIKEVLEQFQGKVNFVFRHFPLTRVHQKAHKAAEAAIAAGQEGKFWEMHERILAHPRELGIISLKAHARAVGVENKRFLDQLMNGDFGWHVQDDLREGIALGVSDVPTLMINRKRIEQPYTANKIKKVIRELLKEVEQTNASANKRVI